MNYLRSSMQFICLTCELINRIIGQINPTSDLFVLYKSSAVQGAPNPINCYQSQFLALITWINFILRELLEWMSFFVWFAWLFSVEYLMTKIANKTKMAVRASHGLDGTRIVCCNMREIILCCNVNIVV